MSIILHYWFFVWHFEQCNKIDAVLIFYIFENKRNSLIQIDRVH